MAKLEGKVARAGAAAVVLMAIGLVAGSALLAQESPFVGTWKLDVAKSHFEPGPAPKEQTRTWGADGMVMVKGVTATGSTASYGFTAIPDEKEHATMAGMPTGADNATTKKLSANAYEITFTKGGEQVEKTTYRVTNGGKTLLVDAKGKTAKGSFHNVQVWSKE